jgi:hypothetical protein
MKQLIKKIKPFTGAVCAGALMLIASSAQAQIYNVDRSFTDGVNNATLIGTVEIPLGSYTIQDSSASPFSSVNLTLTVAGTPYTVDNVLTGIISGTGQFLIDATPTTLTFNTANSNASNPADLVFSDNSIVYDNDRYVIGSNGDPQFEAAYTGAGSVISTAVTYPTVFGTAAVPEPTTLALVGLSGLATFMGIRRRI